MPLERFYGPAICINVTETEREGWIDTADIQRGLEKNDLEIQPDDIILLYTGHFRRTYPGMTEESARWLAGQGVRNFGVEGPNPGHPNDRDFWVHVVCRETGMIHMEGLANLEEVAGQRFTFIGFPLKIVDGTGSPIRAVALLNE